MQSFHLLRRPAPLYWITLFSFFHASSRAFTSAACVGACVANFSNADLRDAVLVWAALTAAYFIGTNLENSDLTGCHVYGVSAWGVKLISEGQTSAARTSHIECVRNTNHKIRDRELSSKSGGTSAGTDWHRTHADLTDPCHPSFPISLAIE